jgi:hypothetical protein
MKAIEKGVYVTLLIAMHENGDPIPVNGGAKPGHWGGVCDFS